MSPTVQPKGARRKYGTAPRRSHESRAITYAAQGMGLQPSTVGQMVRTRGIHLQVAKLIEVAILLQDDALFQRLTAPLLAAIGNRPVRPFSPELINEVQQADLAEDMAESLFLRLGTPESRQAWLGRLRQQHVLAGDLIRAAETESAIRG
jgi:hypothetical protein